MVAHLKVSSDDVIQLRAHYQGVTHDLLRILWRYKSLIVLFGAVGLACGIIASIMMSPRYRAEATLQLTFSRHEPSSPSKTQRIASMEAAALVESTARILRSRALSSAVVSRLGLANDPAFTVPHRVAHAISLGRKALGLPVVLPTAHDLAVDRLSGATDVNIVPRSYVITIAAVDADPTRAALFANAIVIEYLRSERIQQLVDLQQSAERDIAEMSALFGPHHPRRVEMAEKSQDLLLRISALRKMNLSIESALVEGGDFAPAEAVMMPSGPSAPIVIVVILVLWLLACAAVIALIELKRRTSSHLGFIGGLFSADAGSPAAAEHTHGQDSANTRRLASQ